MENNEWNPGRLLELSGGYWQAFTLHAGVALDLFSHLDGASRTADQMASLLETSARGTPMLLDALCAMKLLLKKDAHYTASKPACMFLSKKSPAYIGHMIMHHHHLAEPWSRIVEAVRSGAPLGRRTAAEGDDRREAFLMGMYTIASQQAPEIADLLDLGKRSRLLDLGGGPGTYAIHFCLRHMHLKADVLDLETTRQFAEKTIQKYGMRNRIRFRAADFTADPLPTGYDAVWLSHILHAEGEETCRAVLRKVYAALEPNGLLAIHDFILDDTMDGPLFPALFALNMLQGTPDGRSYSEKQIHMMLKTAGFEKIQRLPYCGPTQSSILCCVKTN